VGRVIVPPVNAVFYSATIRKNRYTKISLGFREVKRLPSLPVPARILRIYRGCGCYLSMLGFYDVACIHIFWAGLARLFFFGVQSCKVSCLRPSHRSNVTGELQSDGLFNMVQAFVSSWF